MNRKILGTIGFSMLGLALVAFAITPGLLVPAASGRSVHWMQVVNKIYWAASISSAAVGLSLSLCVYALTSNHSANS